ncbi:MAG TPA: hypothetical protein VD769_11670 [Gaiellaceae bacterium]|nr:hypothetical protein [Gaiellaceae bacterium]
MTRVALCALLLLPAFAACGGDGPGAPETGGGSVPDAPPEAITAADSGRSFALDAGAEVPLRLSSEYLWSEPQVEGDAVELSRVDYLQDPGFSEWIVLGVTPGTAAVSSLGEPACAGQHGCPDEPVRFLVTITVAG